MEADIPLILKYLDKEFESHKEYLPTGLCKGCRTRLVSQKKVDPKERRKLDAFALPNYAEWVTNIRSFQSVRGRDAADGDAGSDSCDCFTCQLARRKRFIGKAVPQMPGRRWPSGIPGNPIPLPSSASTQTTPMLPPGSSLNSASTSFHQAPPLASGSAGAALVRPGYMPSVLPSAYRSSRELKMLASGARVNSDSAANASSRNTGPASALPAQPATAYAASASALPARTSKDKR